MVKVIFMDCDGVLTDGTYHYSKDGKIMKLFSSIDSKGIEQALSQNIHLAVITEDPTGFEITKARCQDMRIPAYQVKGAMGKLRLAKELCKRWHLTLAECAFIGDDIGDLEILSEVGLPIAVANATDSVKQIVTQRNGYLTRRPGGYGAVREAIDWILHPKNGNQLELINW